MCSSDLELEIDPFVHCNELDTRGSSNVIYWEGPARVCGKLRGIPARGRAFVELVGYGTDSHLRGTFDFAGTRLGLWDSVFNEIRRQRFGAGVSLSENDTE